MSADGRFSPQLQRDGGNLRGLLECSRGQSRSQRIRRICKYTGLFGTMLSCTAPSLELLLSLWFSISSSDLCSSSSGVCTRPAEIVLLFVGSHGPTMNVYIAKWLSLPALRTAHAYDYGPAHRQTGSRKQESGSKHPTQQVQTEGWTDGQTDRRTDG